MLGAACGAAGTTSGHAISGSVTGDVKLGVTVTLSSGGASVTETTNASGAYTFKGLGDATFVATASLPGYAFVPYAGRQVTIAGADVTGQDFVASATITGSRER